MLVPFIAIFLSAIGLAALVGLIKNYVFLYQHSKKAAITLMSASLLALLIPDYWMKGLVFLLFTCVMMFVTTTIRKEQSDF